MDQSTALQNLLNGTASEEELILLKQLLTSGEISIGGNVNHSVIIIGSGNTVELPPAALDRLGARQLLGNLDRDLTGKEIAFGLDRLESELPVRAPVLLAQFQEQTRRLRPSLKTSSKSLSEHAREERVEALSVINSLCLEAFDISFNALCLGEEPPEYDSRSPFRGLESFRPEDSEFFFGRESLIQKLASKIKVHSFLAVLGASGSGKSSLVMAGVIPALDLDYAVFRPGTNPLGELEFARGKSLIVVDQFEELFTLTRDESTRKNFVARLLEESSRARIILTLRSDFLEEVAHYRELNEEVQTHLENVPPMDLDELRRAMDEQAGVVGLRFEADLSQQILDDVAGEPGAMPLLQHALWELWNRRHGRNLRASEYRAFGGVKQAITSTAEKVYADCSKPEQDALRNIFLRLTRLDDSDEGRDTRRRVSLDDLIPSGRDAVSITLLLDKLANARLIMKTVNEDKTEVEVAHEALIRHWERLKIWLNEDREGKQLHQHLSDSAHQWENLGHEAGELYRGARLEQIERWTKDHSEQLNSQEMIFLKASQNLKKRERLNWIAIASVGVALLMMVILGVSGKLSRFIYYPLEMDWVNIPAGEFQMGSSNKQIADALMLCSDCTFRDEQPQHLVNLDEFEIGKFEVTNQEYAQCVKAGRCRPPSNKTYSVQEYELHPVTDVSWDDANTYCSWVDGRLPTEAEWEKAAHGTDGRTYPWGESIDCSLANYYGKDDGNAACVNDTMPVGSYESGKSPYGVYDMAGNVWEWTADWYNYYPGGDPSSSIDFGQTYRVLRGGSWKNFGILARSAIRLRYVPASSNSIFGFRCARDAP